MLIFFLAATILGLTWGCERESISARTNSETLFTLKVNQLVDRGDLFLQTPGQNKYYIVISDMAGKLIDYKELTSNTTFTFDKPEGFSGSEFMFTTVFRSALHYTYVNTTQNVPVGSQWRMYPLEPLGPVPPQPTYGKASLRLTNVPNGIARLFSNHPSVQAYGGLKSNTDYDLLLRDNSATDIWLGIDFQDNSKPTRYFLLRGVTPNSTHTVDMTAFAEGRSPLLAFPSAGYKIDAAFFWVNWRNNLITTYESPTWPQSADKRFDALKVSLPNADFENYGMYAIISKDLAAGSSAYNWENHTVSVLESPIPEKFPVIQADFSLQSSSSRECRFTTTGNYNAFGIHWANSNPDQQKPTADNPSVFWGVSGKPQSSIAVQLPDVPPQLLPNKFSPLKCTTISLQQSNAYQSWEDKLTRTWAENKPQGRPSNINEYTFSRGIK
jgi:hypothetical protein